MRRLLSLWVVLSASCLAGCGGGNGIWVTGVLQKGGEKYTPPEGRKLALYFHPIGEGAPGKPAGEVEMAQYNESDGSFTVPGREGKGIPPGKYRIAVIETLRREALDEVNKSMNPKRGEKRIDKDTNFLEETFGEKSSPLVRDLKTSTRLTLDLAKPSE
jgi:hypothetical protein